MAQARASPPLRRLKALGLSALVLMTALALISFLGQASTAQATDTEGLATGLSPPVDMAIVPDGIADADGHADATLVVVATEDDGATLTIIDGDSFAPADGPTIGLLKNGDAVGPLSPTSASEVVTDTSIALRTIGAVLLSIALAAAMVTIIRRRLRANLMSTATSSEMGDTAMRLQDGESRRGTQASQRLV